MSLKLTKERHCKDSSDGKNIDYIIMPEQSHVKKVVESVKRDKRKLGVQKCRTIATDREKWKQLQSNLKIIVLKIFENQ